MAEKNIETPGGEITKEVVLTPKEAIPPIVRVSIRKRLAKNLVSLGQTRWKIQARHLAVRHLLPSDVQFNSAKIMDVDRYIAIFGAWRSNTDDTCIIFSVNADRWRWSFPTAMGLTIPSAYMVRSSIDAVVIPTASVYFIQSSVSLVGVVVEPVTIASDDKGRTRELTVDDWRKIEEIEALPESRERDKLLANFVSKLKIYEP